MAEPQKVVIQKPSVKNLQTTETSDKAIAEVMNLPDNPEKKPDQIEKQLSVSEMLL